MWSRCLWWWQPRWQPQVHGAAAPVHGVEAQRSMHASGAPTCPRCTMPTVPPQASTSYRRVCLSTTAPCASSCDAAAVEKRALAPASRAPQPLGAAAQASAGAAAAPRVDSRARVRPGFARRPPGLAHGLRAIPYRLPSPRLVWRLTAPPPRRLRAASSSASVRLGRLSPQVGHCGTGALPIAHPELHTRLAGEG